MEGRPRKLECAEKVIYEISYFGRGSARSFPDMCRETYRFSANDRRWRAMFGGLWVLPLGSVARIDFSLSGLRPPLQFRQKWKQGG